MGSGTRRSYGSAGTRTIPIHSRGSASPSGGSTTPTQRWPRARAYRLFRAAGDRVGAARVASCPAWDSLLFGGRPAVARGWLERAARLLADEPLVTIEEVQSGDW
jgi:hypothetical protein